MNSNDSQKMDDVVVKLNNCQTALKLAGKMYLAADLVLSASVFNLSSRSENLKNAIDEYNNFLMSLMQ